MNTKKLGHQSISNGRKFKIFAENFQEIRMSFNELSLWNVCFSGGMNVFVQQNIASRQRGLFAYTTFRLIYKLCLS